MDMLAKIDAELARLDQEDERNRARREQLVQARETLLRARAAAADPAVPPDPYLEGKRRYYRAAQGRRAAADLTRLPGELEALNGG